MRKITLATITLEWFSIQLRVNSEISKRSSNLALTHLKGDLSPVMLNEIFNVSLKISKITRFCIENRRRVNNEMIAMVIVSTAWKQNI